MPQRKIQARMPKLELVGRMLPNTLNEESRTVEMVFATDTPVRMVQFDGWDTKEFNEVLSMDASHVRMGRLEAGAPLLDSHMRFSLSSQMGVVEKAWVEGNQLRGIVKFSRKPDAEIIFQDVKEGIVRNGSIGYIVHRYEDISGDDDRVPTLRAIDWEPMEMSLVPVGADAGAGVRSETNEKNNEVEIITKSTEGEDMAETKPNQTEPTAPAVNDNKIKEERAAAVKEERQRCAQIQTAVRAARLDQSFAEKLIEEGVSTSEMHKRILDQKIEQESRSETAPINTNAGTPEVTKDQSDKRREAATNALLHRANPATHKLSDAGREFAGLTLGEMARDFLRANGKEVYGNKSEIAQRALHTLSDFGAVLSGVTTVSIQEGYNSTIATHKIVGRQTTLPDFKQTGIARLGDFPMLDKVPEGGEVKYGTVEGSKETWALATYSKNFAITRQVIIDNDLDFLSRIPAMAGRAAAELELNVFWAQVRDNIKMADGKLLFHTQHGNLAATGAAITDDSVSAMKQLLRKQVNLSGNLINVTPRFLIVDDVREAEAEDVLAPSGANGGFKRHGGKFELVVEPRITDTNSPWYLFADPAQMDTMLYAYLEGQQGVFTEQFQSPERHGIVIRATLDFAAKAADYRGMAKNPGA